MKNKLILVLFSFLGFQSLTLGNTLCRSIQGVWASTGQWKLKITQGGLQCGPFRGVLIYHPDQKYTYEVQGFLGIDEVSSFMTIRNKYTGCSDRLEFMLRYSSAEQMQATLNGWNLTCLPFQNYYQNYTLVREN